MSNPVTAEEFSLKISDQIKSLPALPSSAHKLRDILADPNCNFDDILKHLGKDPGLCADLIRLANSPFYGMCGRVDTISEAVLTLGMVHLSNFILVAYSQRIVRAYFIKLENLADYFTHSNKVSGCAYCIAKLSGASQKDQEVCKLGGLLHNIGRLVIAVASEQWSLPLDNIPADQIIEEETRPDFYGLDACNVGMLVCQKWHFPESLSLGIGRHHKPVQGDDVNVVALIIFLAEFLIIDHLPIEMIIHGIAPDILERLHLTAPILTAAREEYFIGLQQMHLAKQEHH